jgi:hypothetical protein
MKRAVLCLVCSVMLMLPLAAYGRLIDLSYGWEPSDVQVRAVGAYDEVGVEGSVFATGSLGMLYEVRGLPAGYEVKGYRVVREEWQEVGRGFRIGQRVGDAMQAMEENDAGGVEHVGSGDLLGYRVMTVALKPTRVVDGVVSVLTGLDLEVECGAGGGDLRVERRSEFVDAHLREVMSSLCTGIDLAGEWSVEGYADWVSQGPSTEGGVVDCVIVTTDALESEFEQLAVWHDRLGVRTVVRTLSWIESCYSGSDSAERLRGFLRDAYQKWGTAYVLLGGDATVVPMRYAWTAHYGGAFIPTDLYYSNLEGTWNADGDEIFGEYGTAIPPYGGDGLSYYPQLIVGRAPVRTAAEAGSFVDKAVSYAVDPEPGFGATAALLGEVIFPQDWKPGDTITLDGGAICDTALKYFPADFETSLIYQRNLGMTRTTCLNAYSEGHNFTVIAGHGDAFRTSTGDGDPPYIFTSDFDTLHNEGRYGFTYALNCNNAAMDVDCIFRHLVVAPSGGNFAAYATTRYDFPNVGQYFLNEFLDFVFWRDVTRLGDACTLHNARFIPSVLDHDGAVRWTMLTYILVGDPVVRLWTGEPDTLAVVDAGTMLLSDSLYTVQVTSGGSPVSGAVVTLIGDRGEYGAAYTDAAGGAVLRYRPRGLGWVDLTVSGDGLRVHADSVSVTGTGGRLYAASLTVDDGTGWVGNDDGLVGWGERVGLGVGLRNGGSGVVSGVNGNLKVVAGCSLDVDVTMDGAADTEKICIGASGAHPVSVPFALELGEEVFGRAIRAEEESLGCWLWLDAMGWHVRVGGEGAAHTYRVALTVHGTMLGCGGNQLEPGDSAEVTGGQVVFGGTLGVNDYVDGLDLVAGDSVGVVVHTASQYYGGIGSSEVIKYFDTEFDAGGSGDGAPVWFEISATSGGGTTWTDWLRAEVLDGEIVVERVAQTDLGGGHRAIDCGLRNGGGGGLSGVQATLRGLYGADVVDSISVYGDLASSAYSEGDGFEVSLVSDSVGYLLRVTDAYGRVWRDTVEVRTVSGAGEVAYEGGADYIELTWVPSGDSLLAAYDIYKADEAAGPYAYIGNTDGYSRFVDGAVVAEEDYFYFVLARDAAGNLSAPSETVEAWTGPPELPGWPVGATNVMGSSVVAADVDRDGYLEVIVASKDESVYLWNHDGTLGAGWPRRTGEVTTASPAVANLDADSQLEIVVGSRDGYLYAYNYDGTGLLNGSGVFRQLGGTVVTATLEDLDGNRDFEVIAANNMGQVYVWHHNGAGWINSNGYFRRAGYVTGEAPTVADLDGDSDLEIIVTSTGAGTFAWHLDGTGVKDTSGLFVPVCSIGSAVVGDADYNGDMEMVIGNIYGMQVGMLESGGYYTTGWPKSLDNYVYATPTLASLDGDGKLDVIVSTFRRTGTDTASVYVFSDTGVLRSGWPRRVKGDFNGQAVVGDIDGDLAADIVVPCTDGRMYAWHKDGSRVNGWPRNLTYEFYSSPTICDLDKDGDVDIVVSGYDGLVHAFDLSASYNKGTMEWPEDHHDPSNSNLYGGPTRADVPPIEPPAAPTELAIRCYPNPAPAGVHLRLGVPSAGAAERVLVEVFDVRGRLVKRVVDKALDPGYHDLEWDGRDGRDERVSSGIYFVKVSRKNTDVSAKVVLVR